MANLDRGPQSKTVEKLHNAYSSLDLNNAEPFLSKDFHYELLPESPDLPKQTKETHLQTWGKVFSSLNKFEVRI